MENPFESGHIKNYLLFYGSIVVIMILFFIASSLFLDVEEVEKKVFNAKANTSIKVDKRIDIEEEASQKRKFKLLPKIY